MPVDVIPPPSGATSIIPVAQPPDGRYLLLEHVSQDDGTGSLPFSFEPFGGFPGSPRCDFDAASGRLAPLIGKPITLQPSDWGVWCHTYTMSGSVSRRPDRVAKADIISQLPGVQTMRWPSAVDAGGEVDWREGTIKLVGAALDGSVELSVGGQQVVLAPGETWQQGEQVEVRSATTQGIYRKTHRVTNYGWQDRALLAPRQVHLLITSDGGLSWSLKRSDLTGGDRSRWYIACPTAVACYLAGDLYQTLLVSGDGGQTWTQRELPTSRVGALSCPLVDHCFAGNADTGQILATSDGGVTWQEQFSPAQDGIATLDCPTAQTCFAGGPTPYLPGVSGWIVATSNGGAHWDSVATGLAHDVSRLTCPTVETCYVMGSDAQGSTIILKTLDGGRNWIRQPYESAQVLNDIRCVSALDCFLKPFGGQILRTVDGGQTWSVRDIALVDESTPDAPICPTAHRCYARGPEVVYSTTDGGNRWDAHSLWDMGPATISTISTISAMSCPAESTCIAVLQPYY